MQKQFIPTLWGISLTIPFLQIAPVRAVTSGQVSNIAQQVVVFIKTKSGHGSGVIIKHVGNTYTILTAAHVVNDARSPAVEIVTPDRQSYDVQASDIQIAPDRLDLATVTFESEENYPVVKLGDSNTIAKGQTIFTAGFLGNTLHFYPGKVVAISRKPQDSGYGLVVGNADILPGMSGGGLFNEAGTLVGIDGKSIGTIDNNHPSQNGRTNMTKPVSGLAIPINTFAQVASQLQVEVETPATTPVASTPTADDFFVSAQNKSEKGDRYGAIADYNQTLALNPNFQEVYFRRGLARNILRDWQGAQADYSRAIELKPDHGEAYINRGVVRNVLADWARAKFDFDIAIIFNPRSSFAYDGRGIARCKLKDYQGGITDLTRAIALNPNYPETYANRGQAYYAIGNKQNAIDDYVTAAEIYRRQGKNREYLDLVEKIRGL
jgi:S1-C subfamily serine protease/Tfp pilus assembly protein PilF